MAEVALSNSRMVAVVDDEDYDFVVRAAKCWRLNNDGYATASIGGKTVGMHRLILGLTDPKWFTDHINHDTLDNRRSNLRPATRAQSSANRRGWGKTSRFKGVRFKRGRYEARIRVNGRLDHIGCFTKEEDAARAYDARAREAWDEFARCNFREELEEGAA